MTTKLFAVFAVIFLALLGTAVYRDQASRGYIAIQQAYQQDHPTTAGFDAQVQQLFPSYSAAKVGDTFRVERCISCHVPDIAAIGPAQAAKNISADFQKYGSNVTQQVKDNGLTLQHPAFVTINSNCLPLSGVVPAATPGPSPAASPSASPSPSAQSASAPASPAASPASSASPSAPAAAVATASAAVTATAAAATPAPTTTPVVSCPNGIPTVSYADYGQGAAQTFAAPAGQPAYSEPGYLPAAIDPATATGGKLGIDQIGCIVCHNGGRLSLSADDSANSADRGAHENLIVNPTYVWTKGASLYYQYCVSCHAVNGTGGVGPPLSNQDRLGFFNEDYYYRCIEYGMTGFEHQTSGVMPNWGSIAPDFDPSAHPDFKPNKGRVLTEQQINTLVQFIRHWQQYQNVP